MAKNFNNNSYTYTFKGPEGYIVVPQGTSSFTPISEGSIRFNHSSGRLEIYASSIGWSDISYFSDITTIYNTLSSLSSTFVLKTGDTIDGNLIFTSGSVVMPPASSTNISFRFSNDTGFFIDKDDNYNFKLIVSGKNIIQTSANGVIIGKNNANINLNYNNNDINFFYIGGANFQNTFDNNTNLTIINTSATGKIQYFNTPNNNFNIVFNTINDKFYIDNNNEEFKPIIIDISGKIGIGASSSTTLTEKFEVFGTAKITNENSYILPLSAGTTGQVLISNGPNNPLTWQNIVTFAGITVSSFGGGSQIPLGVSGNREIGFRSIVGNGIVEITQTTDTIVVSASRLLTISSLSTDISSFNFITSISSNSEIIQRPIKGKGAIDIKTSAGNIIVSSFGIDPTFIDSNYKLVLIRNFGTSPGTIDIIDSLSAYNEIYVSFHNIRPDFFNPLIIRVYINDALVNSGNLYKGHEFIINNGTLTTNLYSDDEVRLSLPLEKFNDENLFSGYIKLFTPNGLSTTGMRTSWFSEGRHKDFNFNNEIYYKNSGYCNVVTSNKLTGIHISILGGTPNIIEGLVKIFGR